MCVHSVAVKEEVVAPFRESTLILRISLNPPARLQLEDLLREPRIPRNIELIKRKSLANYVVFLMHYNTSSAFAIPLNCCYCEVNSITI